MAKKISQSLRFFSIRRILLPLRFEKSERKNEKNFDDDGNSGWTYSMQHKQQRG